MQEIPEASASIDGLFQADKTLAYVSAIEKLVNTKKENIESPHFTNTIKLLSAKSNDLDRLQKRIIMTSLVMFEGDIFEEYTCAIASGCGFGLNANFDKTPEELFVGQYHESITSILLQKHAETNLHFKNVSVTLDSKPVEFDFKPFDTTLYLKFLARSKGEYNFSFDLITNYLGSDIDYKQHFETKIIAKEELD